MQTFPAARSAHFDEAGREGLRLGRGLVEIFVGVTDISIIAVRKVFGHAGSQRGKRDKTFSTG